MFTDKVSRISWRIESPAYYAVYNNQTTKRVQLVLGVCYLFRSSLFCKGRLPLSFRIIVNSFQIAFVELHITENWDCRKKNNVRKQEIAYGIHGFSFHWVHRGFSHHQVLGLIPSHWHVDALVLGQVFFRWYPSSGAPFWNFLHIPPTPSYLGRWRRR